jgi:hypothetical protein
MSSAYQVPKMSKIYSVDFAEVLVEATETDGPLLTDC